MPMGK
jgi:hypothetical protein